MKVVMVTCPERTEEAARTLRQLEQTDFPGRPFSAMDPGPGFPSAERHARHRHKSLIWMLDEFPRERLFLLLEDDITFADDWWAQLERWGALERYVLCASLYRPGPAPLAPAIDNCLDEPAAAFYGGQALLVSRRFVQVVLEHWDDPQPSGLGNWDKRVGAAAAAEEIPLTYRIPCLVQHRCAPSLVGSLPHHSECFSRA